jgi:hypothetical protein
MLVAPVAAAGGAVAVALGRFPAVRHADTRPLRALVPVALVTATAVTGLLLAQEAADIL